MLQVLYTKYPPGFSMAAPVFNIEYCRVVSLFISSSFSRHLASTRRQKYARIGTRRIYKHPIKFNMKRDIAFGCVTTHNKNVLYPHPPTIFLNQLQAFKEISSAQILPVSPKVLRYGSSYRRVLHTYLTPHSIFSTFEEWATFMAEISCTKNKPSENPGISETVMLSTTTALSMAYELISFFSSSSINSCGDIFLWLIRRNTFGGKIVDFTYLDGFYLYHTC